MSSIDDTQAAIDALENPEPDEPEVAEVESGTDEPEAVETEASEPILGKFKTQEDLVKAYQELERNFTQERQQAVAEPEAQPEPAEPFNPLQNYGYDDSDWANIARSVQTRPEDTMAWALEQGDQAVIDATFGYWHSLNPFAAQTFAARQAVQEERQEIEQLRNEWKQEQEQKAHDNSVRSSANAVSIVQQKLPDFDQYKGRVAELMNDFLLPNTHPLTQSPEGLAQFTEHLYWIAKGEEFKRQEAAAQTTAPAKAAGSKARTQTRSTATSDGELPADVAEIFGEILAGQPGRN